MSANPKTITLAHGSGGSAMQKLIDQLFINAFSNPFLQEREDQARLPLANFTQQGDRLAFTTDSYVIDPVFFPGGDIGKIAVCGTINDLVVGGAKPLYLSCACILEEGLPFDTLEKIVNSIATTAREAGVQIVTGDTKVVPHGAADKIFINTAGIGAIPSNIHWGIQTICPGDKIIASGTIGDHGATILNLRENLKLNASDLRSDCAVLSPLVDMLRPIAGVRTLRDATRGGINAVMHEYAQSSGCGMEIKEGALPLTSSVRGVCELLGLDPLNFANEGKLIIVVAPEAEQQALDALHNHPLGQNAATIGETNDSGKVTLQGLYGVTRVLDLPQNEPLPRIC